MIVSLSTRAVKDIRDLDPVTRQRVVRKIDDIEQDRVKPEPLTGDMAGLWKVYVGLRWRILLEISPDLNTAIIVKVAPRRKAYR
jgi:mRNA-degrading endonuclease RelE of RelBE toxin-antitoxin system